MGTQPSNIVKLGRGFAQFVGSTDGRAPSSSRALTGIHLARLFWLPAHLRRPAAGKTARPRQSALIKVASGFLLDNR